MANRIFEAEKAIKAYAEDGDKYYVPAFYEGVIKGLYMAETIIYHPDRNVKIIVESYLDQGGDGDEDNTGR